MIHGIIYLHLLFSFFLCFRIVYYFSILYDTRLLREIYDNLGCFSVIFRSWHSVKYWRGVFAVDSSTYWPLLLLINTALNTNTLGIFNRFSGEPTKLFILKHPYLVLQGRYLFMKRGDICLPWSYLPDSNIVNVFIDEELLILQPHEIQPYIFICLNGIALAFIIYLFLVSFYLLNILD